MSPIVTSDYLPGATRGCCSDAMRVTLTEVQRIPTWGARAVEPVQAGGRDLLAIPQLAKDVPGGPPGMNGGDSDTELLLLNRAAGPLRALGGAAGAGRRGRGVLHHRRPLVPGRREHQDRRGPLRVRHHLDDLRVAGRRVRPVPGGADVRGQAVEALAGRRPALPRPGPGSDLPARARRAGRRPGRQPGLGRLRVERRVVRRVPAHSLALGLQLARLPGGRRVLRRARRARGPQRPVPLGRCAPGAAPDARGASPAARSPPSTTAGRATSSSPASPPRPGCCA